MMAENGLFSIAVSLAETLEDIVRNSPHLYCSKLLKLLKSGLSDMWELLVKKGDKICNNKAGMRRGRGFV